MTQNRHRSNALSEIQDIGTLLVQLDMKITFGKSINDLRDVYDLLMNRYDHASLKSQWVDKQNSLFSRMFQHGNKRENVWLLKMDLLQKKAEMLLRTEKDQQVKDDYRILLNGIKQAQREARKELAIPLNQRWIASPHSRR